MTAIRALEVDDLPDVLTLSLRAWQPVFASLRRQLGDSIFLRLHPDWEAEQADAVRATCTSPDRDVFVAVDDGPVGFVVVALDAYHPRMGAVDMIAVNPDYQRRGIAREMIAFAAGHMKRNGMDIAVVETGGDPGHAPARRAYEAAGYTLLPIARYFQLLHEDA